MKSSKFLFCVLALAFAQSSFAAKASPVAYMDAWAIEDQHHELVAKNYAQLAAAALPQIQGLMPSCGFPAGNEARIEQLSNLKLSDLKYLGSATLVRNEELEPEIQTPRFLSIELYYNIPAAHGAPAINVGVAFKTPNLAGVDALTKPEMDKGNVMTLKIYRVPLESDSKLVSLKGLKPSDPRSGCLMTDEEVARLIQQ